LCIVSQIGVLKRRFIHGISPNSKSKTRPESRVLAIRLPSKA
jgi:hypothetical protein